MKSNFHDFRSICGTYELLLFFFFEQTLFNPRKFHYFWWESEFLDEGEISKKKVINETFFDLGTIQGERFFSFMLYSTQL